MFDYIKKLLQEKERGSAVFKRNLIKEYLQVLVLSFYIPIKNIRDWSFTVVPLCAIVIICRDYPKTLILLMLRKRPDLNKLAKDLVNFFKRKYGLTINAKVQKFRCTLKFPILHMLEVATPHESNYLFSKIEVYREFEFCKEYNVEIKPIFKFGEALLIRTFDLPTLMATKIRRLCAENGKRRQKMVRYWLKSKAGTIRT